MNRVVLCSFFSSILILRTSGVDDRRHDLIVVGAGISGLVASHQIKEKNDNLSILVLEARDRIGGRVNTVTINDSWVLDLGAHYISSPNANFLYKRAKEANALEIGKSFFKPVLYSSGKELSNGEILTQLLTFAVHTGNPESNHFREFNGAYWEFMEPRLEYKLEQFEDGKDSETWFPLLERLLAYRYNARNVRDLNVKSIRKGRHNSDLYTFKGGFKELIPLLTRDSKQGQSTLPIKIETNKEVVKITYGNDGVKVSCSDGSSYGGEKVLITLPLGVLKTLPENFFIPPLQEKRMKAIKMLGFGNLNKIYLEYDKPWWPADEPGFFLVHSQEKLKKYKELFGDWAVNMVDFHAVEHADNFLTTWLLGEASTESEGKSEEDIKKACTEILQDVFPNATEPIRCIRTKWESDPYSKGTTSYITNEAVEAGVTIEDLAEPILNSNNEAVVAFAGEAMTARYYGSVHGAIMSGLEVVEKLYPPKNKLQEHIN